MRRVLKPSMMVFFMGILLAGLSGCGEKAEKAATAADGLDLYTVASLVKSGRARNAEELRTYLACGQGYNNLDLDSDGFCEDVNVTEYGNLSAFGFGSVRGYSLSVQMSNGSVQEIARLQIRNDTSGVVMFKENIVHMRYIFERR